MYSYIIIKTKKKDFGPELITKKNLVNISIIKKNNKIDIKLKVKVLMNDFKEVKVNNYYLKQFSF